MSEELCDSQTGCVNQVGWKFKHTCVVIALILIFFFLFYFCFTRYVKDILFVPEQQIVILTEKSVKVKPEPAPLARDRFFPNNNPRVDWLDVDSSAELIGWLKEFNLWDIPVGPEIPAMIVTDFPAFGQVDVATKKKMFINTLLPVALTALTYVEQERDALLRIIKKTGVDPTELDFAENSNSRYAGVTSEKADLLRFFIDKYRTSMADELIMRVNVVPVSLILAQGAIESSWGASRFALTANNLFGMRTWGEEGIVPTQRDAGKNHKIVIYESILDSVQAYILNLNRLPAYNEFRRMRQATMDSVLLANGLSKYSIQREDYIWNVQAVIHHNHLRDYDKCLPVGADKMNVAAQTSVITRL